ncbi:E3 ubiquitin-protein ligase Topors [Linepithema humile]|uniref:E3 ubiquitin-protein ligase Topors n=1 Tax=Linepithema humile TaxID=83485 RepID=UPI0006238EBF|nr:PREDICTED: E3 ubiquitin-protein ligase Topors-like [Linepithema humile]
MMEGPLEIKNSSANVEEPIKSEALVQNSDSSERNDGATSPPPNCSICLGKLVNTSFTDSCLHQFCFTCLLQWSKIKTECPLCKQKFKSIINNVRSEEDYDQYHVPRKLASQVPEPHVTATLDVNFDVDNNVAPWEIVPRRFVYRTTMTGNRRPVAGPFLNPEQIVRREQLPSMAPQVPREERIRRRTNPTDYRRTIYRHGIWATSLPDVFGRFRECSAEYYRRHPQELDRLVPWLNRELQVLLNNEPSHCAYVLSVIMDALTQFDIRSGQFRDTVRPFFTIHTNHFAHELLNFAQTNFDLVGYDQSVTYLPRGLSNEYARIVSPTPSSTSSSSSSSITSDNSDVRILDEAIDLRVNTEMPSTISHPISMPGPSTAGSALPRVETTYYDPELLILSSSSESDGECEIIGYVKPRHERTPEIIELLSSESEPTTVPHTSNENTQLRKVYPENLSLPSTSHGTKESSSLTSCSSTSSDSDSDYNQRQSVRENCSRKLSQKKFIQSVIQKYKRSTRSRNKRSKKRIFTSSDTSLSEASVKNNEKRSKKTRYKVQTKGTGRIKLIKREQSYSDEDSSSSESSSEETDSKVKISKCRRSYRSKRKHSSPTANDHMTKSENTTKGKGKASVLEKLRSKNKDQKYCESKQSRSRSSSESSDASKHDKRSSHQESRVRYQESRNTSEYESQDDSASIKKDMPKKEYKAKSKKKVHYCSDSDHLSSCSQCSDHSNKSYTYRKKSKRREKHKEKEHHRSNGRAFNSSQSNASTTLTISVSSKNDMHPSKHSDKEKRKSYKVYKDSKRRKPENEKKSRPKKKRRRLRSSSISNSV